MKKESLSGSDSPAAPKVADKDAAGKVGPDENPPPGSDIKGMDVAESVERFLVTFERSAKRWEMVVYPAMFAFVLLAGYGFFLIYSLTSDMRLIADSFDPQMGAHMTTLSDDMQSLTDNIQIMTGNVEEMSAELKYISKKMDYLEWMESMGTMEVSMTNMNQSINTMAANFDMMRRDMSIMNRNISKPMSFMNNFVPW